MAKCKLCYNFNLCGKVYECYYIFSCVFSSVFSLKREQQERIKTYSLWGVLTNLTETGLGIPLCGFLVHFTLLIWYLHLSLNSSILDFH